MSIRGLKKGDNVFVIHDGTKCYARFHDWCIATQYDVDFFGPTSVTKMNVGEILYIVGFDDRISDEYNTFLVTRHDISLKSADIDWMMAYREMVFNPRPHIAKRPKINKVCGRVLPPAAPPPPVFVTPAYVLH